jgi:FKBP-type peptidyl-prolyl cis-trans isomerase FkpA
MTSKREGVAGKLLRIIPAGVLGWAVLGCDTPPDLQPIAPPGAPVPRKSPDEEAAQAQGETPAPAVVKQSQDSKAQEKKAEGKPTAPSTALGEKKNTPGGVEYETLKEGTGPEFTAGQTGLFRYEGKLENGRVFDSNKKAPEAMSTDLSTVIKGWQEGLPGMKVGEVRRLTIPPEMAYGARGAGSDIPPNATLIFEVELVKIHDR